MKELSFLHKIDSKKLLLVESGNSLSVNMDVMRVFISQFQDEYNIIFYPIHLNLNNNSRLIETSYNIKDFVKKKLLQY